MNGEGFAYFRWHQLRNATPYIEAQKRAMQGYVKKSEFVE